MFRCSFIHPCQLLFLLKYVSTDNVIYICHPLYFLHIITSLISSPQNAFPSLQVYQVGEEISSFPTLKAALLRKVCDKRNVAVEEWWISLQHTVDEGRQEIICRGRCTRAGEFEDLKNMVGS